MSKVLVYSLSLSRLWSTDAQRASEMATRTGDKSIIAAFKSTGKGFGFWIGSILDL